MLTLMLLHYIFNSSYIRELPRTFVGVYSVLFSMILSDGYSVFSPDSYPSPSIKSYERAGRGDSSKLIIGGPKITKPSDC